MWLGWRLIGIIAFIAWAWPASTNAQSGGRWWRAESANFVVYGRGEAQTRIAARSLEDLDATLRILLRVEAPQATNKLEVYLVRDISDLREVSPGIASEVAGFYAAAADHVAAFAIYNDSTGLDRRQILFHEYAHHFMLHYAPQAYPRWYVEGWAEFVSNFEVRGRSATVGGLSEQRGWSLADSSFMPIEHFLAPERLDRQNSRFWDLFYAQSWFAATYIANRPERAQGLVRYVDALGQGGDPLESFEPAFHVSLDTFEEELRAYRRGRVQLGTVRLPEELPAITITRMPRSADDLLLVNARLKLGRFSDDRADFASEVERRAARFSGDALAERAAARAALWREDPTSARARLEPLLAANENDVEARYLLAQSYLQDADTDEPGAAATALHEARRHFVRAFRADANHFPTLYRYGATFANGPAPMSEEQLNVLARALELAPQVHDIRMLLAVELIRAEEYDAAVVALRPLMYSSHSLENSRQARWLAQAALRREQPLPMESEPAVEAEGAEKPPEN